MIKPNVDVIIPVHNQLGMVIACVESLKAQPRIGKVVIIDDNSSPDESAVLKTLGTSYYHNIGSSGFVKSCRRGVSKTDSPYFLLLNSDTIAFPNAIEKIAESLDEGYAIVGSRLIFPPKHPQQHTIQHAGVGFSVQGVPYHPFMGLPQDEPCVLVKREVNAVTGAAMAFRREWWDKVGGFDKKFYATYEDVEICLSIKRAGGSILYNPDATFYHWQHGSQTNELNWFTQENLTNHLGMLMLKHGKQKPDDHLFYRFPR